MAEPFLGEVRIFPFGFAPTGWAACNGQLLSIAQNTALFSLLGTTFGGDGRVTFGLPNLQGRLPLHAGQHPGGSQFYSGEEGGEETVLLNGAQLPVHTHALHASNQSGEDRTPANETV